MCVFRFHHFIEYSICSVYATRASFYIFRKSFNSRLANVSKYLWKRVSSSLILFKFVICYFRLSSFPVFLFLSSGTHKTNIYSRVWIYMYIKSYRVKLRRCLHFMKMYFINSLLEANQQYKRQIRMPFHHS